MENGANITQWECVDQPNVLWYQTPSSDGYFHIVNAHSGKCLHQHGATLGNGDNITQWECVDQPNVEWKFVPN